MVQRSGSADPCKLRMPRRTKCTPKSPFIKSRVSAALSSRDLEPQLDEFNTIILFINAYTL